MYFGALEERKCVDERMKDGRNEEGVGAFKVRRVVTAVQAGRLAGWVAVASPHTTRQAGPNESAVAVPAW